VAQFRPAARRCRDLLRIVAQVDRPDHTAMAEAFGMPHGSLGPTRPADPPTVAGRAPGGDAGFVCPGA
jgi:hypothetical protein